MEPRDPIPFSPRNDMGVNAILTSSNPPETNLLLVDAPAPSRSRAAGWRQQLQAQVQRYVVPVEVPLPSGQEVLAVRPHLLMMYQEGMIPNALTPVVSKLIQAATNNGPEGGEEFIEKEFKEDTAEAYTKFTALLDFVWVTAVIDPIFVLDLKNIPLDAKRRIEQLPEEERASSIFPVSRVSLDDKLYFFNWCQGVDEDIATFRQQQAIRMAAIQESQAIRENAERNSRAESSGG